MMTRNAAAARARVCGWLAGLFSPNLPKAAPRRLVESVRRSGASDEAVAAAAALAAAFPRKGEAGLLLEYTRLFHGPGSIPASPYESIYRDGGILMGPTSRQVAEFYEAAGLTLDPRSRELPDHIALELGFLQVLALREALAARAGRPDEAQAWHDQYRRFLREHLACWAEPFVAAMQQGKPSALYAAAGQLLTEWVRSEAR